MRLEERANNADVCSRMHSLGKAMLLSHRPWMHDFNLTTPFPLTCCCNWCEIQGHGWWTLQSVKIAVFKVTSKLMHMRVMHRLTVWDDAVISAPDYYCSGKPMLSVRRKFLLGWRERQEKPRLIQHLLLSTAPSMGCKSVIKRATE